MLVAACKGSKYKSKSHFNKRDVSNLLLQCMKFP